MVRIPLLRTVAAAVTLTAVAGVALLPGDGTAPALAGPKPTLDVTAKVHPLLQLGAQVEPDKKVRVLVTRVVEKDKAKDNDRAKEIKKAAEADDDDEDFAVASTQSLTITQKNVFKLARNDKVRFISPDAEVKAPGAPGRKDDDGRGDEARVVRTKPATASPPLDPAKLVTSYPEAVDATDLWTSEDRPATGKGVTVAVLDTGIAADLPDFAASEIISVTANRRALGANDANGHGTHVTGIIAGRSPDGKYVGIAPNARVISVKIADEEGNATESDLLRALQWVYNNRQTYNIRAINLSVSAAVPSSYMTSPLDAAVEQLWFSGVVVVAAAGNRGTDRDAVWYAPGNDPYVITVGCIDDGGTDSTGDDTACSFGSRGTTQDGFAKPEVMAPGRKIVSPLASKVSTVAKTFPERITPDGGHIRMSGTSMSAPVVTGIVAQILERYPNLRPDQVKSALMMGARPYKAMPTKAGEVSVQKALELIKDGRQGSANRTLRPSPLLALPVGVTAGATGATQSYWDQSYWDQSYWDQSYWDQSYWD